MIALAIATWLAVTPSSAEQRGRIQSENTITRTPTSALLTGDATQLHNAIATVGATAEIRFTPVANNPGGPYAHGGFYGDANIVGQRLSVPPSGGRTFWIAQVSNWGPSGQKFRAWQGRIDSNSFLGTNADCGGGPGSCAAAGDLTPARPACVTDPDCVTEFGESGALCRQQRCDSAFINIDRQDNVFSPLPGTALTVGCNVNNPDGPLCFGTTNLIEDSIVDQPGVQFYAATYVIDVPIDAEGVYTMEWTSSIDTFFIDESSPPTIIPLAAVVPGELNVIDDLCPGINPLTHCCDPLTGVTTEIPPFGPCTLVTCDGATPILTPQPVGAPCTSENVCAVNATCSSDGLCVGAPAGSPTLALVTGDPTQLQKAIAAGGATAEIRLTPVANNPGGAYGHGGYYDDSSVTGQRLSLATGGGRTFWIAQVSNWGPNGKKLRAWQGRIDSDGFLGANADCGGGLGSCAAAGDLTGPRPACVTDADCITEFGEEGAICAQQRCDSAFINGSRTDHVFATVPEALVTIACGVNGPAGPICFGTTSLPEDSIVDQPGVQFYAATYVIDVPIDAAGVYTMEWVPIDTFFIDETIPLTVLPLAAMVPGILDITMGACCVFNGQGLCIDNLSKQECTDFPTNFGTIFHPERTCPGTGLPTDLTVCLGCIDATDCNDLDACTADQCNLSTLQCTNPPVPWWDPETSCCNPASGDVVEFPTGNACMTPSCSPQGELVLTPVATCSPCQVDDPCMTNGMCSAEGSCIGSPTLGPECEKSRYISFTPVDNSGAPSEITVNLVSLHRPTPPYSPGIETKDFSAFEGQLRWVGEPFDCPDSPSLGTILKCATLTCAPTFLDWTALTGGLRIHITGDAIVPSSVYDIEQWPEAGIPEDPPLRAEYGVRTARWGDVGVPFQDILAARNQPNVTDIVLVVDKVKDALGSLAKPRIQLRGNVPDPTLPANSTDIVLTVDAVKGDGFPYAGPTPCNP
jgi:hypothetical protein